MALVLFWNSSTILLPYFSSKRFQTEKSQSSKDQMQQKEIEGPNFAREKDVSGIFEEFRNDFKVFSGCNSSRIPVITPNGIPLRKAVGFACNRNVPIL